MVVSSAVLVAATNVAAGKNDNSFIFGYWNEEENSKSFRDTSKINGQASRKDGLAFVPLAKASSAVDPEAVKKKDDVIEEVAPVQNQSLVHSSSVPLRAPEEDGGVKVYEVKSGDTVSSIAAANSVTTNTILWANDIDDVDSIMPGDKIFILPVSGLGHTVKKGDTLKSIAKEYEADEEKIIAFNDLPANGEIEEGQEIIIPGGWKEVPQEQESGISRRQYATTAGGTPEVSGWKKLEGKAGTGHRFPYGYCTWYVSQKRYIPWGGNAGTWLYRAKAMGYKTGKKPKVGAIIVTSESWWGHVGVVEKVKGNSVTISEMNYKGWGKTNKRTISNSNRVIKGYIY